MVSQAETIRNLLFDNWTLGDELSKVPLDNMKEIVYFYDRRQVEGNEQTKAITVEKINAEGNENIVDHPSFSEVQDWYTITIYYRAVDVQQTTFSDALSNVDLMGQEIRRILEINYNPATTTGQFFLSKSRWTKRDMVDQAQPELIRAMEFQLTQITSKELQVFHGYGGILIFDTGESSGDNLPNSNYEYTELNDVVIREGFTQIPYLTKDTITNGRGVPYQQRGMFSGEFVATIMAKKDDIEGTTADKIYNLIKINNQSPRIGQNTKAVLLHDVTNNEDPTPATFRTKSFMKISNIEKVGDVEGLIEFRLTGTLFKPTEAIIS